MSGITDDIRIREIKALITPNEVMGEFAATGSRGCDRDGRAQRPARHRAWPGRPARGRDRPVLDPRSGRCDGLRAPPQPRARRASGRSGDRHARLLLKAAHHRRLEGVDQRSRSRRLVPHRRRPEARAQTAARHQQSRAAGRLRIPRYRRAAIRLRSRRMGRDRRANHRKPGASRAGVGPLLSDRLQERHRRQGEDRHRCGEGVVAAASLPGGDQGRPLGDRIDHGQSGLPHHPARRRVAELRCAECRPPSAAS